MIEIGTWQIYPDTCTLRRGDTERHIPPRSMDVLVYLSERPGEVVSARTLLESFWPSRSATDHAVHKVLASLRQALEDEPHNPTYLKTFPKRGYALIAKVERGPPTDVNSETAAEFNSGRALEQPLAQNPPQPRRWLSVMALSSAAALIVMMFIGSILDREPETTTIALIPRSGTTGNTSDIAYLKAGLDNSLIANLSRLPELVVLNTGLLGRDRQRSSAVALAHSNADYLLTTDLLNQDEQLMLTVNLADAEQGTVIYADQLAFNRDNLLPVQDALVTEIVDALSIYLDEDQRRAMHDWGTQSAKAYDHFIKAEFYARQYNHRDWETALALYEKAIAVDPRFVNAYSGMATAANYMAVYSREDRIARLKALLDTYGRKLEVTLPGHPVVDTLKSMALNVDGINQPQLELIYREQILRGDAPGYVYAQYGLFLIGARMYDEAAKFLALAETREPFVTSPNQGESFSSNILPPWELVEVKKMQLYDQPAHIGILGTVVSSLALMGKFDDAQYYLEQQQQQDVDGIRAHFSQVILAAANGEIYRPNPVQHNDSEGGLIIRNEHDALFDPAVLSDPDLRFNNGFLSFLQGNFGAGEEYWRQLSPSDVRKLFTRLHASEVLLPPAIINDERYADLLEELGAGRSWQRQLMEGVTAMADVTGVSLHENSVEAYTSNRFMVRNNLWSEQDWDILETYRRQRINEIQALADAHPNP